MFYWGKSFLASNEKGSRPRVGPPYENSSKQKNVSVTYIYVCMVKERLKIEL